MKINQFKQLPGARVEASITVPKESVGIHLEELIKNLGDSLEVPGFRKGMAPRLLVLESIGLGELKRRAASQIVSQAASELIVTKKLSPIAQPSVTVESFEISTNGEPISPLTFRLNLEVLPEVKLGDYRKIRISPKERSEIDPKSVTSEDIEGMLKRLSFEKAELIDPTGPIKQDDWAEISFNGTVGGVIQEKLSSQHHPMIVGSGVMVPGFEDNLIGMKQGATKRFSLKLPKQEQEIEFTVTVNQHKAVKPPELNDQFASQYGEPSMAALKAHLAEAIGKERHDESQHRQEDLIIRKLVELTTAELPATLVERELERLIGRLRDSVLRSGTTFEAYLSRQNQTIETLREQFRKQAEFAVKTGLALAEVAKQEKIDTASPQATAMVVERLTKFALQ
ncbi:MAG: trigger factor [Patescibacteria group bacterium]